MEERLRPVLRNNSIINLKEILEALRKCHDEILLNDYYDEVKEFSVNKEIKGLLELEAALSIRLEELVKGKVENKNVLNKLQEQNPNLTGISLIETKKEKNDSAVDTDYLKYTDENGRVFMLECKNNEALSELLSENAEVALYGSTKEIFDYFNKYKYHQMEFYNPNDEDFKEKQEERAKENQYDPRITDVVAFTEEQNILNDYKIRKGIETEAKVSINSYGERIYTLEGLVIKFRDSDNKRKMEIISDSLKNQELEEDELKIEAAVDTLYQSPKFVEAILETEVNNLISKLYDGMALSIEELNRLHSFMLTGLNKMLEEELHYDYQNTIDIYIVYLEDKEILSELTKEEKQILFKYREIIRERERKLAQEESIAKENGEIKELKFLPTDLNTNGAVVTIVILEVTLLLGILISALALVKR